MKYDNKKFLMKNSNVLDADIDLFNRNNELIIIYKKEVKKIFLNNKIKIINSKLDNI